MIFEFDFLTAIVAATFSIGLAISMYKRIRGTEDEDAENCGLRDTRELLWENAMESQRLTDRWTTTAKVIKAQYENRLLTGHFPRSGFSEEVTVTSNRCEYCGTKNEQDHGTCCKCGAPL